MLRIRQATFEDAGAIAQLNLRHGMGDFDKTVWRENWEAHPFASEFNGIPIGWVIELVEESTGKTSIVGNLNNHHMLYELGGKRIKSAVTSAWAVDLEHRGKSLQLIATFLRQPGIDLWMNVSANPTAAQIMTALKLPRIPIPDYGTPCFWALHPRAFAGAALRKRSVRGANILAWPAGLALRARDVYRRSGRGVLTSPVRRLLAFDDRFDELWLRISAGPKRLRAVRTRAVLAWRFREELRGGRALILAAEQSTTILGYAVLVSRKDSDLGMALYDVADLQAVDDNPAILRNLLLASIKIAREEGADALKFLSGTPSKRAPADALWPYTYQLPFWQQYFKASGELTADLSAADSWDISWFDTF